MNRCLKAGLLIVALCVAVGAWQAGSNPFGVKDSELPVVAKAYLLGGSSPNLPGYFELGGKIKSQSPAERAQQVRQLAAYAKQFVSTPAFETTYAGWIKQSYNAVDHGLKPRNPTPANAGAQMMSQAATAMATSMKTMPPQILKTFFDNDLQGWKDDEEKASLYARARKIVPLFNTNQEEWKRQYILLKSESMGGPTSEAGLTSGGADLKLQQEQSAWDQYNLKATLKKRLQEFVTLARSVDFSAQTQPRGKLMVFANSAYEQKPPSWKQLYRLGKEPTAAAIAAAELWLKEL